MDHLPDFTRARITVFGDVMLDKYWGGDTSRISPEAPVLVVHVKDKKECPGGAGNVALNIASLGANVSLFAHCGYDEAGDTLARQLQERGVDAHLLRLSDIPTVTKLRVLSMHQQLLRLDFEDIQTHPNDDALIKAFIKHLSMSPPDTLILSDYAKGALNNPQALIQAARKANIPVLVDPKRDDFSTYRGATLVTPNYKEFEAVVGHCADDDMIHTRGYNLLQSHNLAGLLITRGEKGMTLLRPNHAPFHLPAGAREVFDVTGAGDTVVATFAAAMACNADWELATILASAAAAIVVGKIGAAAVTPGELHQHLKPGMTSTQGTSTKVLSVETAATTLTQARSKSQKIAIVADFFDILTPEHLANFNAAKTEADLVVAVIYNDDALTHSYKPIHSLEARVSVLSALRIVDWVVPAGSTWEASQLIESIKPETLLDATGLLTPVREEVGTVADGLHRLEQSLWKIVGRKEVVV
jgi:D-beta-D-heptose 7-phosphate kinase / D-beta-D-heptose 1-phosphate adenosyltransferase